jgi:hypothetical protein
MSRIRVICPSCIGLGSVMCEGQLLECSRCHGDGRVYGKARYDGRGTLIDYIPDSDPPEDHGIPG